MHGLIRRAVAVGAILAPAVTAGAKEVTAEMDRVDSVVTRVVRGSYRNSSGERPWTLHLPEGEVPASGRPMIVMLHGCTQDPDDIARGTLLHEFAAKRGWMVLYPGQPESFNPKKCWNWFDPAHQQRDAGEPSIIAGMTAAVAESHGGDASRVYLAGISAGAAMATLVAAAYPERFRALALHSGLVYRAARNVAEAIGVMQRGVASPEPSAEEAFRAMDGRARVIPALVIHGEADAVVAPINGAQAARQWFLSNALAHGQPLDTTSGATDRSESNEGGYRVTRSVYRAKDGTPLSRLVMVQGLGHAWSGGSPDGSFTDAKGPSASELMLDFFASLDRR